jgi:hypothetical protein
VRTKVTWSASGPARRRFSVAAGAVEEVKP